MARWSPSKYAHQHKDDDDDEHDAENTGGVSSPGAGVGPGRYGADQQKDQDNDEDSAQGHATLLEYGEQQGDLICAWGIVQLEMDVKEPEKTAEPLNKRCVMILRRDEGEWRVLMDCWSRPRINEYVTFFDDDPNTVRYYDYSEVAAPLT